MPQRYVCLKCGYRWQAQAGVTPSRCAALCGSSYILPEDQYKKLMGKLKSLVHEDTPFLDRVVTLKVILEEFGLTGRPLRTLGLVEGLLRQAQQFEKAEKYISVEHERKPARGVEDLE